jgi:predicted permease
MGIPLLAGRTFDSSDRPETTRVVVINQLAAERFWPNADPIGKRIRWVRFSSGDDWLTIAGIVGNVRYFGMDQPPPPTLYRSDTQWAGGVNGAGLIVRTDGNPDTVAPSILAEIRGVHPDTLISEVRPVQGYVDDLSWGRRLATGLLSGLAALALLLAAVGVYGVLSHAVGERRREIGIRMALGAKRSDVVRNVIGHGLGISAAGIFAGLMLAAGLTRFLQSLLFGVEPLDAITFLVSGAVLLAAALLASYLPARRAAGVDPMAAVRHE